MSNLHVIYRTCQLPNKNKERPDWMDNSGFRPEWFNKENAFKSILNELGRHDYLHVLFDGYSENHFLEKYLKDTVNTNFKFLEFDGGSDAHSYKFCLEYIEQCEHITSNDLIYLVEDDYLHNKGWKEILWEAFDTGATEYWTLFDHPDKYSNDINEIEACKVFVGKNCYWRTATSTTNTIAFKMQTFLDQKRVHYESCDTEAGMTWDHQKFIQLKDEFNARISYPIPGYSTHLDKRTLSSFINWQNVNDSIK